MRALLRKLKAFRERVAGTPLDLAAAAIILALLVYVALYLTGAI